MNIYDESTIACVGCGYCEAICPFQAIKMKFNNEGFFVPYINLEICTDCGACKKTCLKYEVNEHMNLNEGKIYAAWAKDKDVLSNCSSGGIGYIISLYAFRNGYDIWGVVFDKKSNKAKHMMAKTENDIKLFSGSKYLQSDTDDLCNYLKEKKNPKAVVIGTPCQIQMVRLATHNYPCAELICIDVFCRGVPTLNLWNNYLSNVLYFNKESDINFCTFRDKRFGWHNCQMTIASDRKQYSAPAKDDWYYKLFTSALCFRDSCYFCNRKLDNTYSDIRIGDFWGDRFKNNDDGVSLVIINSEKGEKLFNSIKSEIDMEDADWNEVLAAQKYIINDYNFKKIKKMRTYLVNKVDFEIIYKKLVRVRIYKRIIIKIYQHIPQKFQIIIKKYMKG